MADYERSQHVNAPAGALFDCLADDVLGCFVTRSAGRHGPLLHRPSAQSTQRTPRHHSQDERGDRP